MALLPFRWSLSHSPGRALLLSVLGVIGLGTLLLSLPAAQIVPHSLIDLIFTATSATCVTGLLTIPLYEFTFFGKCIILLLIQIGGLGLITMTVFLISLFFQIGMKPHLIAGQLLELDNWKNSKKIIAFIIVLTACVELMGALLLWQIIPEELCSEPVWFSALFHSISSFCSAGFSIFPGDIAVFSGHSLFLILTMLLILVGEMGFITWHELFHMAQALKEKRWFKVSLHTKIVLYATTLVIALSTAMLWFLERGNTIDESSPWYAFINTLFNGISFRSCGFTTLSIMVVQAATVLFIMIIAFIGCAPGSTGSGIKVTSVALLFATAKAIITERSDVEILKRRIPHEQIFKAFVICTLAASWVIITTFLLLLTESGSSCSFIDLLFEAIAAFANLGLTLNVTPFLSNAGKIIIMVSMIIGRIGALTLILAMKRPREVGEFQYPEERIMLS